VKGVLNLLNRFLIVQTDDELVAQRGRLLNIIIWVIGFADVLIMFKDILFGTVRPEYLAVEVVPLIVFSVLYLYARRGHRWPPQVFLAFLALVAPYAVREDLLGQSILAVAIPVVVTPLIAAPWLGVPVAIVEAVMVYVLSSALDYPPPNPLLLVILGVLGSASWLSSWIIENALREARRQGQALAESNRELEAGRVLLEARTHELERRSAYLQGSAEVGRTATTVLQTEQLVRQVVELIRDRFGLYYVGLFLLNESGEWAVLRAGTGDAGREMLARGHRIRVGEGMIGWSIAHAQARVALDAGVDAVRLATPELPDTRSEAALPLRSRDQVLGALTVQSDQSGAFDKDTIVVLQTMADQVAIALDNARLFSESQAALEATRRVYGELSREVWAELIHAQPNLGFIKNEYGVFPVREVWRPEMRTALQTKETATGEDGVASLAMPIKVRGQVIGVINACKPEGAGEWTPEQTTLLETMTEQLGVALESARLYQDAQRRAARERLVGDVTARMRETLDLETVLKTATREIGEVLGLAALDVRLGTQAELTGE
jgi:GAF domain-containing protein